MLRVSSQHMLLTIRFWCTHKTTTVRHFQTVLACGVQSQPKDNSEYAQIPRKHTHEHFTRQQFSHYARECSRDTIRVASKSVSRQSANLCFRLIAVDSADKSLPFNFGVIGSYRWRLIKTSDGTVKRYKQHWAFLLNIGTLHTESRTSVVHVHVLSTILLFTLLSGTMSKNWEWIHLKTEYTWYLCTYVCIILIQTPHMCRNALQ